MRLQTYRLQIIWPLFPFTNHREAQSLNQMAGVCEVHVCVGSETRGTIQARLTKIKG